jgi:Rrf2 family iron-sulfur cluster assembly transcriptional regulator
VNPISRSSEYAIRALTFLALQGDQDRFFLARDMAQELSIPAPFLGKVLQPLVSRGLLISQRGRRGGFKLAQEPKAITLFHIVDAEDHLGKPRVCFLGQAECNDDRACPMHDYWKVKYDNFLLQLNSTSLLDLTAFCAKSPDGGYPAQIPPALFQNAKADPRKLV